MTYTEGELLTIYEDVLSVSASQTAEEASPDAIKKPQVEDDLRVIKSLEIRFFDEVQDQGPTYRRILERAHKILSRAEDARQAVNVPSDARRQKPIPLGILSLFECEALVRAAVSIYYSILLSPG